MCHDVVHRAFEWAKIATDFLAHNYTWESVAERRISTRYLPITGFIPGSIAVD